MQPVLSGHLAISRGRPLNTGSTVFSSLLLLLLLLLLPLLLRRKRLMNLACACVITGGSAAAAMVAADIDEGAGEGWGEDAALVIDEGEV